MIRVNGVLENERDGASFLHTGGGLHLRFNGLSSFPSLSSSSATHAARVQWGFRARGRHFHDSPSSSSAHAARVKWGFKAERLYLHFNRQRGFIYISTDLVLYEGA